MLRPGTLGLSEWDTRSARGAFGSFLFMDTYPKSRVGHPPDLGKGYGEENEQEGEDVTGSVWNLHGSDRSCSRREGDT